MTPFSWTVEEPESVKTCFIGPPDGVVVRPMLDSSPVEVVDEARHSVVPECLEHAHRRLAQGELVQWVERLVRSWRDG